MSRPLATRRLLAAALVALAGLVAACGSTSPSSTAAPSASTAPDASAAASPAASGAVDPVLGVTIGAPYTLVDLPASKADALQAGIEKDLGAFSKAVRASVREIQQGGTVAGYLMVVAFPRGTLSDNIYSQVITDLSMGAEQPFTSKLISNVPVQFGSMGGGSVAVLREGDLALITLSPTTADLTPVVTALVKANG
jgi:hypothetical protein